MEPDALLELPAAPGGAARCSLWWRRPLQGGPSSDAARIGRIGRLQASSAAGARLLLERACSELRRQGCHSVLAPLDGDTWQPYRVLAPGQDRRQAFAGEPNLAPEWAEWLMAAGFCVRARYLSALCSDLQRRRPIAAERCGSWRIEPLAEQPIEPLLEPIRCLIVLGFAGQPLFRAPGQEEFRQLLGPWRAVLDRRLSLLAFDGDDLVGLLLAHGDPPGTATPGPVLADGERAVVRTLVVRPGRAHAGLGRLLLETCHGLAAAAGCQAVIHALMHDPGASLVLSRPYAQPVRHYWLMERSLADTSELPNGIGGDGARP